MDIEFKPHKRSQQGLIKYLNKFDNLIKTRKTQKKFSNNYFKQLIDLGVIKRFPALNRALKKDFFLFTERKRKFEGTDKLH